MKNLILELTVSSIHAIAPIAMEPRTVMTRWRLMETTSLDGERSRHLVGQANGEGRVSSDLVKLDVQVLRATTQSGRIYELQGPPANDFDADYVFSYWMRINSISRSRDLTRALIRLRLGVQRRFQLTSTVEKKTDHSRR